MSTLAEIEKAIAALPPEQWVEIRRWMDRQVPKVVASGRVEWAESQAATRPRPLATRLDSEAVAEALAAVRE